MIVCKKEGKRQHKREREITSKTLYQTQLKDGFDFFAFGVLVLTGK